MWIEFGFWTFLLPNAYFVWFYVDTDVDAFLISEGRKVRCAQWYTGGMRAYRVWGGFGDMFNFF